MAEVDHHAVNQSHDDENSAPNQHDGKTPKPLSRERPMTTPAVSQRTPDAQYPMDNQVPRSGQRDRTAPERPLLE